MFRTKNIAITSIFVTLAALIFLYFFFGSDESYVLKEINPNIKVHNLLLLMKEKKTHQLMGYKGVYSPCIHGHEFDYEKDKINVGFRIKDGKARIITTKNPETEIYSIKVGMKVDEARKILETQGLTNSKGSSYKYYIKDVEITLLSLEGHMVDGISIEILD